MRKPFLAAAVGAAVFAIVQAAPADDQPARDYVVLYEQSASDSSARDAVEAAGGTVVDENAKIGVATVRSSEPDFKDRAAAQGALVGAASDRPIGTSGPRGPKPEVPGEQPPQLSGGARQAPEGGRAGRSAELQPVGHADDRRHAGRLVQDAAGEQEGARRASSTRASTATTRTSRRTSCAAVAELHHRQARHRRAVRGGAGQVLQRPRGRRRGRARHARGRHRRLGDQRRRHRRRGTEDRHREPARRPGLRLLLPAADAGRADVRRRSRDRRREHVRTTSIRGSTTAARSRPTRRPPSRSSGSSSTPRSARCATPTTRA